MKKMTLLALSALLASTSVLAEGEIVKGYLDTHWVTDPDTTIIKHKKGWAPVLVLKGDRGTGLKIEQGNKEASGIVMTSGGANLEISPSYVAAGVPGNNLGFSKETAAAVFKVSGAKLSGTGYFSFDHKQGKIYMLNDQGMIEGYIDFVQP